MTEENKTDIKENGCKCFCQAEWFKEFILKTLAVFIGVFCALSLFSALHRPKMPPCPFGHGPMMRPCHVKMHHFEGYRGPRGDFHKKIERRNFHRIENKNFGEKPSINPEKSAQ